MLKYYDDDKELLDVGLKRVQEFNYWRQLLNTGAESQIRDAINVFVGEKLARYGWTNECWFCSSYIPGNDWDNTPYEPIYNAMSARYGTELAWNQSRLFFGLLVKDVMIRRPEHWRCYKVPDEVEAEKGTNYFPDFTS